MYIICFSYIICIKFLSLNDFYIVIPEVLHTISRLYFLVNRWRHNIKDKEFKYCNFVINCKILYFRLLK